MEKVLILSEATKDDWARKEWRRNGIEAENIFKPVNKWMRGLRRICMKYNMPYLEKWYEDWIEKVTNAELIIIHMSYLTLHICEYINRINPNAKVIAWYWNSITPNMLPSFVTGICEKWSFDPIDCQKYNMKFNHQYYFKSLVKEYGNELLWDVYFCGSDSGRGKKIISIYNVCQQFGFKTKFQIVYPKSNRLPKQIISNRVDYEQICRNISKSKAILEIVREGQSGPTIRLMESLFFGKKLITNNMYVKKETFFNEKNIFLLGERDINELKKFMEEEFAPYDKNLIDNYDVKRWIQNFINGD